MYASVASAFAAIAVVGVLICVLVSVALHILDDWRKLIRHFRFSLFAMFLIVTQCAMSLGIYVWQMDTDAGFFAALPVSYLVGLTFLGLFISIVIEFRMLRKWYLSDQSTLDAYRDSQPPPDLSREEIESGVQANQETESKKDTKLPWWLKPMPNRFKGISHRDGQSAPTFNYYYQNDD